ncbi:MAG: hypothetical protein AB1568_06840 [Thermodesulfobacteriota bacterium]
MNNALIFPDILLFDEEAAPLLALFDRLRLYQATAKPLTAAGGLETHIDRLLPAPLGDDEPRFLAMIQELSRQGEEYSRGRVYSQSAGRVFADGESVHELIGRFAGSGVPAADSGSREGLWRARLLLQLDALSRLQEADLQRQLREIRRKQAGLFGLLHGEDGNDDEAATDDGAAGGGHRGDPAAMVRAWGHLHLADADSHALLATNCREVFELVTDTWKKSGRGVEKLFAVELPRLADAAALAKWRQQSGPQRTALAAALPGSPAADLDTRLRQWQELAGTGRIAGRLELYRLSGGSSHQALALLCRLPAAAGPESGFTLALFNPCMS